MTELGLPRWKNAETKKQQKFIEDDDEIPDLRSDDEDSDDEDNNTAKHLHWRLTHNEAARSTASTNAASIKKFERISAAVATDACTVASASAARIQDRV